MDYINDHNRFFKSPGSYTTPLTQIFAYATFRGGNAGYRVLGHLIFDRIGGKMR